MTNLKITVVVMWTTSEGDRKARKICSGDALIVHTKVRPLWPSETEVEGSGHISEICFRGKTGKIGDRFELEFAGRRRKEDDQISGPNNWWEEALLIEMGNTKEKQLSVGHVYAS